MQRCYDRNEIYTAVSVNAIPSGIAVTSKNCFTLSHKTNRRKLMHNICFSGNNKFSNKVPMQ